MQRFAYLLRAIGYTVAIVFCFGTSLIAEEKPKRLRDPNPEKVPCALYLTDVANASNGVKVADPTPESLLAFFDSNPDLIPRLAYRDEVSAKGYRDASELRGAIESGTSEPFVNSIELAWVGLPRWGKNTRELLALTEKKLQEKYPDIKIKVRHIWRPNRQMSNLASYAAQQLLYLFPSPKLDFQPPIPSEVNSAYSKLVLSNGSQQIFLFFMKPWYIAVTTGAMNFVNSYYTGVYRKFLSNWFSRSNSAASRWTRNIGLTSFFNANLYWAAQGFYDITNPQAWGHFIAAKWASTVFGVLWRFFYGQGIIRWEAEYPGHQSDARRTAGRLEFLGTFITTPAFIYSVVAPSVVNIEIGGVPIMGLNGGHFMMMGVGAVGALFYYKLLSWDPWVARLDRAHEFNKRWAGKIGLMKLVDLLERGVRGMRAIGWGKTNGNGNGGPLNADVRELIDLDRDLVKWLREDPDLHEIVRKDPELRELVETDPHFEGIRDEILKDDE